LFVSEGGTISGEESSGIFFGKLVEYPEVAGGDPVVITKKPIKAVKSL